jgi:polar amino acid transport system permease protein
MSLKLPTTTTRSSRLLTSLDKPQVVPVRHPGTWLGILVCLRFVAGLLRTFIENPNYQWDIVWHYFSDTQILKGIGLTLQLTFITLGISFVLGTVLAVGRTSKSSFLNVVTWSYVWFFRGTPLLVQIVFWYNIAALYPVIEIGIPFGPTFVEADGNALINAFTAAVIAFGLNQSAYMCEIIRAGLLAVDEGQREAATALGLSKFQVLRKVVAPQAMRVILPAVGNQLIDLLKSTALVSVIALPELLYSAQLIYSQNFLTIPVLLAATLWYLIITTVLSILQYYVERYYSRGSSRNLPLTPTQKAKARWNDVVGKFSQLKSKASEGRS